jgi:thiol-disulfide isomerase/thioredoxin
MVKLNEAAANHGRRFFYNWLRPALTLTYMRLVWFCLLTFSFLLVGSCRPAAAPVAVSDRPVSINDRRAANAPLPPAKPLSDMSWTNDNEKVEKLKDLAGKVVILDFWATYCEPCKREIPHLNSLLAKYGPDNLYIVGLNVGGEEDRPRIPAFVASTKIDYNIAFPEDDLSNYIFASQSDIPQTAIFDRKGRMVKKIVGFSPAIQKELDEAVATAIELQ